MTRRLDWEKAARRDAARVEVERPVKQGRRGDLPATPKQLAFLRQLGVEHGGGLTRLGAAALIEAGLERRAA